MTGRSPTAVAQVLGSAVLFGTTGTAQALGPAGTTPVGVGSARLALGGALLLCLLPLVRGDVRRAAGLWRTRAGLMAGACTAAYQLCFFAAVQMSGVALGTLVTIGSGPVFAGLLAAVLLRERPGRSWVAATGLCVAGLALLSGPASTGGGRLSPAGPVLALGAGLAYAGYTVATKRLMTRGENSSTVMGSAFGLGAVLLLPVLATQPLGWVATASGSALVVYLGAVTIAVAYVLFGRGLRVLAAGPVTTLVLAEPLVALTLGVTVLGEHLDAPSVAGAGLVVAGLALQAAAVLRPGESRHGPGGRRGAISDAGGAPGPLPGVR